MKIKALIISFSLILVLFSMSSKGGKIIEQPLKTKTVLLQYVSYEKKGKGTGNSKEDAADFLNTSFWAQINKLLEKQPIKVVFLEGDYKRAYTERHLSLREMGHPEHLLTIEGIPEKTIFTVDPSVNIDQRGVLMDVVNSQNIKLRHLSFTGNGKLGYALRITSNSGKETKNILVEECAWTDMRGIIYGTTGVHQKNTKNVTYLNCTFKRVGIDSHSHHIYNAYNPSHIYVIDSHFEDCTGDFVRFRDSTDYCVVRGSKFIRNKEFRQYPFISMPNFNKKRTESFASNYAIFDNEFINNGDDEVRNAIALHHYGFDRPGFNYLLTPEEGDILTKGPYTEKKKLLLNNFGINPDLIRVHNNSFSGKIRNKVAVGSFPQYGAESKGWKGFGDIYNIVKSTDTPFEWETPKLN